MSASFAEKFAGKLSLVSKNGDVAPAAAPAAWDPPAASHKRSRVSSASALSDANPIHTLDSMLPTHATAPATGGTVAAPAAAIQPSISAPLVRQPSFRRAAPPASTAAGGGSRINLDALRSVSMGQPPPAAEPEAGSQSSRFRDFSPISVDRAAPPSSVSAGASFRIPHESSALAAAGMAAANARVPSMPAPALPRAVPIPGAGGVGGAADARRRASQARGRPPRAVLEPQKAMGVDRNEALAQTDADKLVFSRKARVVEYTPHSLSEYRSVRDALGIGLNDPRTGEIKYHELGRLGPDLSSEELKAKRAARDKARLYAVTAQMEAQARAAARGPKSSTSPTSGGTSPGGVSPMEHAPSSAPATVASHAMADDRVTTGSTGERGTHGLLTPYDARGGTAESTGTAGSYMPLAGMMYGPTGMMMLPQATSQSSPGGGSAFAADSPAFGAPPIHAALSAPVRAGRKRDAAVVKEGKGSGAAAVAAAAAARKRALEYAKQVPRPRAVSQDHAFDTSGASPARASLAPVPEHGMSVSVMYSDTTSGGFMVNAGPPVSARYSARGSGGSPRAAAAVSLGTYESLVPGLDALQQQHARLSEEAARIRRELAM